MDKLIRVEITFLSHIEYQGFSFYTRLNEKIKKDCMVIAGLFELPYVYSMHKDTPPCNAIREGTFYYYKDVYTFIVLESVFKEHEKEIEVFCDIKSARGPVGRDKRPEYHSVDYRVLD